MPRSLVIAIASIAFLLAGCEAAPVYSPPPEPTIEPFFPEEEDALAAFEAFMGEYVAALTQMTATNGVDDTALRELVGAEQYDADRHFIDLLSDRELTFGGEYAFYGAEIQQWNQDTAEEAFVQAYVCLDYSKIYYARADGTTYQGEAAWAPYEAIMTADASLKLTLDEMRLWTGRDFCAPRL